MADEITLEQVIDFAIETENLGHHMYTRMAKHFRDDPELGSLFAKLAEDEKHHAEHFAKLKEAAARKGKLSADEQQYLRAVSISEIFSGPGAPGKKVDEIKSREDALARAYNLEKTSLLYYHGLREVLQDDLLEEMIAEERNHITQVMKYMVTGAEFRGLGDKF